jgi:hypothetical protein
LYNKERQKDQIGRTLQVTPVTVPSTNSQRGINDTDNEKCAGVAALRIFRYVPETFKVPGTLALLLGIH